MKICLVTAFPPSQQALNEYGFHIARELQNLPELTLSVLADHYSPLKPELDGYSVERCWAFGSLSNIHNLLRAIRKCKPDVVWFNLGFASFGGTALPAFLGIIIPALTRLQGYYTHVTLHQLMETVDLKDAGVKFPLAYKLGGVLATQAVLCANSVSVMLPAYRDILREKYGRGSVLVRRHGSLAGNPEYPDFTQRGNPEHRILAFGKWGTYKRLELMVEAFEQISHQVPSARLVIAGTDHPKTPGYLESIAQHCKHNPKVSFQGYVAEEDIAALFQGSSIAVMPYTSSAGSSGIAHLASSYGVPIVASDIPEFRQLADEEGLAIDLFEPGNADSLASHTVRLLENGARQEEMALQNVSAAFQMSMPEIIRQYLQNFRLRKKIDVLSSLSRARKMPRWSPFRRGYLALNRKQIAAGSQNGGAKSVTALTRIPARKKSTSKVETKIVRLALVETHELVQPKDTGRE